MKKSEHEKKAKVTTYNNNYTAVECGMNIQTAESLHQTTFTEEKVIKELFVSKAQEEDVEYPKCCFGNLKGRKVL